MSMTRTDIQLTIDLQTELDDTGDFDTVTRERETIRQRAMAQALNVSIPFRGDALAGDRVEDLRDKLQRAINNDDVIDGNATVTVTDVTGNTVTYKARVNGVSFEIQA